MINELDKVLHKLLTHALPIRNGEVDIAFDQPKREWSARLSRPTLNLFLHDIRENKTLRQHDWEIMHNGNGRYNRQRKPIRLDLHYMITAWANKPHDEHLLLTRTLLALVKYPVLPPPKNEQPAQNRALWRELAEQWPEIMSDPRFPIRVLVAQNDGPPNLPDLWSALDNELRPAIDCLITIALNPFQAFTGPLVQSRELRLGQAKTPASRPQLDEPAGQERFWLVGGRVHSDQPPEKLKLSLLERGLDLPIREQEGHYHYFIGNLESGDYTLELSAEGRKSRRHKITVPAGDYDIEI
jgi:hypothetical protein